MASSGGTGDRRVRPLSQVSDALLRAATDEVTALLAERFPLAYAPPGPELAWPVAAGAFVMRCGELLESVTRLVEQGRSADSFVLIRVLYEHATTFCWIAIDPEDHQGQWMGWADYRQKALHNEAKAYGVQVLTPEELAALKPVKPPSTLTLAEQIDKYWPEHSSAFRPRKGGVRDILTFRGMYTAIFRRASGLAHAAPTSLDRQITGSASQLVVGKERPADPPDLHGVGVPLMAFVLVVYAHHFGWPDESKVRSISDFLMYES